MKKVIWTNQKKPKIVKIGKYVNADRNKNTGGMAGKRFLGFGGKGGRGVKMGWGARIFVGPEWSKFVQKV